MSRGAAEWLSRMEVKLNRIGEEVVENRRLMDVHIQELKDSNQVLKEAYDEMLQRRQHNEGLIAENRRRIEALERSQRAAIWVLRGVVSSMVALFLALHEHIFAAMWHWLMGISSGRR